MKLGKVEIRLMYEKWPSWALGFWIYYRWFGCQVLMFKLVIDKWIDRDSEMKALEWPEKRESE